MTKLTRLTGKIFGETATATGEDPQIGQFGSALAGTYVGTTDVSTIQSLPAWSNGFIDSVTPTTQFPPLPEMTGFGKVLSYQNAYLLQKGVAEWDSGTTYYEGDICKAVGSGELYVSKIDNNINNALTDDTSWDAFSQGANQDLSNLTNLGNARLQYAPFAINDGVVLNGENNTLTLPTGSSTTTEAVGSVDGVGVGGAYGGSANITRSFDTVKTLKDVTVTSTLYPASNSTAVVQTYAVLSDNTEIQLSSRSVSNYVKRTYTDTYTFTTPQQVKGIRLYCSVAPVGSCGVNSVSYTEIINVTAGEEIINSACTITTCDGRTKVFNDSTSYEISSEADGDYLILKDFESGNLSLISNLDISKRSKFVQPILTANGTLGGDSFAVEMSVNAEGRAWKAFDGIKTGTDNAAGEVVGSNSGYYIFYNPTPINVTNIAYTNYDLTQSGVAYGNTTAGAVYGSNDGSDWTQITTYTNSNTTAGATWNIDLSSNTSFYKYYKITRTANSGSFNYWSIQELTLTAYTQNANGNWLDVSTIPAKLYIDGSLNNDLVYIGDCTVLNSVFTSVTNRAFNDSGYAVDKNVSTDAFMPDYNAGISVTSATSALTAFTAPSNGIVLASIYYGANNLVYINGKVALGGTGGTGNLYNTITYILNEGDTIYVTGSGWLTPSGDVLVNNFYPLKGAN